MVRALKTVSDVSAEEITQLLALANELKVCFPFFFRFCANLLSSTPRGSLRLLRVRLCACSSRSLLFVLVSLSRPVCLSSVATLSSTPSRTLLLERRRTLRTLPRSGAFFEFLDC